MTKSRILAYLKRFIEHRRIELSILFSSSDVMLIARAAHLQANISIAMLGSMGTSAGLVMLIWDSSIATELLTWLGVSTVPALIRLWLLISNPRSFTQSVSMSRVRRYLRIYFFSTVLAGLVFGIGWLVLVPRLEQSGQFMYLMAIIALLFGGLHAYSPHFPCYLGFSVFSVWSVPFMMMMGSSSDIENLSFLMLLVGVVSTMFAIRFSVFFSMNLDLRKNIEHLLEELTIKHEEALSANSAKSRFLAAVSHDLRQPMHAVSLYVASLDRMVDTNANRWMPLPELKSQVMKLSATVSYMNEMFETLLDMSRLDAGVTPIDIKPVELHPMLERLEQEYSVVAAELRLSFQLKIPENDALHVMADANALERLLRNLISNALKNTPTGGVRLRAMKRTQVVEIRIVDTGVGIARELRGKIFQEFFQIHQENKRPERKQQLGHGFGLGLAIAQRFANRMNTDIHCHSWEGRGSVFSVKLPSVEVDVSPFPPPLNRSSMHDELPAGLMIVIVDDDPEILTSTSSVLQLAGATIIQAASGDEIIHKLVNIEQVPDLILSDFRLSGETGVDVIELLRHEFNTDIPALLITGETSRQVIEAIGQYGYRVLFKPLSAQDLIKAIAQELSHPSVVLH